MEIVYSVIFLIYSLILLITYFSKSHDKKQTLAVALGWMNVGSLDFAGGGLITSAHTRDSYTKIASISYQRNF